MKYFIKTFGCQMNIHESEKIAGMLHSLGYTILADSMNDADVIVFNTCCIRDGVEQKIMGNIGSVKKLKQKNPNLIIAVCGCMSQAEGRSNLIKSKFPFVDIIFGTHNIHSFKTLLESFLASKNKQIDVWPNENGIFENVDMIRDGLFSNAWVNINFGCNNFCSYCIVPYVRGRERSRKPEDIIKECTKLISEGYKYITLLGQNVNSYGKDFKDKDINFANLLSQIADLDGEFRIKFMTSHPKDFNEDVVKVIAQKNKICNVIHLPIQSGSTSILKAMNRQYSREHYLGLINMIKKHIPDAYISTDLIVGFPGETEDDFNDTCTLVQQVQYDGVFAFMFSRRSGTVADKMENQISEEIKKDRIHKLLEITKGITKSKNKNSIGKIFNVIAIENTDDGYKVMSDCGKTIFVNQQLNRNSFYKVKITKFAYNKLFAELI